MNSITINGKTLELQKTCPACEGKSAYANMSCWTCGNTGIVERYWTPEEVEESGFKVNDDCPVFHLCISQEIYWDIIPYGTVKDIHFKPIMVLAFPFQPAPPKDYLP